MAKKSSKASDFCLACKRNLHVIKCTYCHLGHHSYNGKPAIKYKNGTRKWLHHGLRHRLDGPAVYFATGDKEWWISGANYTEREWKKEISSRSKKNEIDLSLLLALIPVVLLGLWIMD